MQSKMSKGKKVHEAKSKGKQVQVSMSSLPVESHRLHVIPLALTCDSTSEMLSSGEAH